MEVCEPRFGNSVKVFGSFQNCKCPTRWNSPTFIRWNSPAFIRCSRMDTNPKRIADGACIKRTCSTGAKIIVANQVAVADVIFAGAVGQWLMGIWWQGDRRTIEFDPPNLIKRNYTSINLLKQPVITLFLQTCRVGFDSNAARGLSSPPNIQLSFFLSQQYWGLTPILTDI